MAEAYTPWRQPVTITPSELAPSLTGGEVSCPLYYPSDAASLRALESVPVAYTPPPTQQLWVPPSGPVPAPAGKWPTTIGDQVRMGILVTGGPKTVRFYGRFRATNGTVSDFAQEVTGNSATVLSTRTIGTGTGEIIEIYASAVGGVGSATIFLIAELGATVAGSWIPRAVLLTGLLTDYGVATSVADAGGGGGGGGCCPIDLAAYSQAGGTNEETVSVTVGADQKARMVGLTFRTLTGPAIQDRTVVVRLDWGSTVVWLFNDPTPVPANTVVNYKIFIDSDYATVTWFDGSKFRSVPAPGGLFIPSNFNIFITNSNSVAGDAIANISAIIELS